MPLIAVSQTLPINPGPTHLGIIGALPVLSHADSWAGLRQKVDAPHKFLTSIANCKILGQKEGEIRRLVSYRPGEGPPGEVEEIVRVIEPIRIDVSQPKTGARITHIVAPGTGSLGEGENDLHLTLTFEFPHPEIAPGSEQEEEQRQKYRDLAKQSCQDTIDKIREMKENGEI